MEEDTIISLSKLRFLLDVNREAQVANITQNPYGEKKTWNMEDMKETIGVDDDYADGYHAWRSEELNGS
jgi:hypothetical protein